MASVELEQVRKAYRGRVDVLKGIDLTVRDGEFLTLVGPSGCGKSTLLALIAGLDTPTAGTIRIDGEPVNDRSPKDRDVAMVFQSYALYPHMNVRRNLAFPLENAHVPRPEIAKRVDETAQALGIANLLERKPRELSGGQRQRVALGRALVRRPKVFLFDEPLSNLDAELRVHMRAELKRLHERLAATFIYVTHDQAEALTLSDRVVALNQGIIQQCAPPREMYDCPANLFVASFVGSPTINLVPPETLGMPARAEVVAGIRPDDVLIGQGPPPEAALVGTVDVFEPMGAFTWVTLQVGHERLVGRAGRDFAAATGAPAWGTLDRARILYFNRTSTLRVDAAG